MPSLRYFPGCPPLETVVAFWTADERRHQFKLYKPLREVLYDDVGWLMFEFFFDQSCSGIRCVASIQD